MRAPRKPRSTKKAATAPASRSAIQRERVRRPAGVIPITKLLFTELNAPATIAFRGAQTFEEARFGGYYSVGGLPADVPRRRARGGRARVEAANLMEQNLFGQILINFNLITQE